MIFVYLIPVIVIIITNIEVIKEVNRFVFETRFSFYLIVYFKDSSTRKSIEQKFQWTISTSTISYWTSCNAHCYFYHWYFKKRNSIIIYRFFFRRFSYCLDTICHNRCYSFICWWNIFSTDSGYNSCYTC